MKLERVVLICGRYEGVDERVSEHLADREISVGDFVLSGGELGAAIVVDAVTRLLPGALGNAASAQQGYGLRLGLCRKENGLQANRRDGPAGGVDSGKSPALHAAGPVSGPDMQVPEVLVNGNHDEIREWRRRCALQKTLRNRPDLLRESELSEEDRKLAGGDRGRGTVSEALRKCSSRISGRIDLT